MKKHLFALIIIASLIFGCGSGATATDTQAPPTPSDTPLPPTATDTPPSPTPTDTPLPAAPTSTPPPPTPTATATPTPTATPEPSPTPEPTDTPTPEPVVIDSAEGLHGVWHRIERPPLTGIGGLYIVFNEDGTHQTIIVQELGLSAREVLERLTSSPHSWGEYWFEDGKLHVRDLGYASGTLLLWKCDPEVIGTYQVQVYSDNQIEFKNEGDRCLSEGVRNSGPRFSGFAVPFEWVAALPEAP